MIKVLVIEDVKMIQKILSIYLNQLELSYDIAGSGKAALDLIARNAYDIIFMDVGLPDIDGITLTETLRKKIETQKLPIIALTAHSDSEVREACKNYGMDDFLVKPVSLTQIQEIISKYTSPL